MQREGFPDMDLIAEEITALTFAEREKIEAASAKVHLQLRDGGWFSGDALTMENGTLLLTLPGGQRIEIPREHAQSVTLSNEQAPQIYDGPTGLAGWSAGRTNQGQWEYKDGFLTCISNGPITRNFEQMPDPLDLSFDVVFPPQLQHFSLSLFGGAVNQVSTGTLTIQFSPNQISGHHYDGRRTNQYSVQLQPDADGGLAEKAKTVRYRLLVDRVNGRALIYVGGIKRADWKLSKVNAEDIGKCGATFSFSPNVFSSSDQVRLGRIRLLPWDGKMPWSGVEPTAAKADRILTGDGKIVDGTIEKITGAEVVTANPQEVTHRDKTLHVLFAAAAAPKEQPAAVAMVRLKNGGEFAVTEIKGGGATMTLTTRFGSQIALPLSSLREMNFLAQPGQPESVVKDADLLTFTDGTQLKGKVIAPLDGDKLRWKIAASKTPLEFPGARVAGIFFSRAKDAKDSPALKGASVARLGSGDWLPGDVVSLDEKQLVMKTDLSPELMVPLSELRGLYLSADVAASVSDGATGRGQWMDGWNPNRAFVPSRQTRAAAETEQPWMYHDGGYELRGVNRNGNALLARKWPAYAGAFAVNLEIANPGRNGSFNIQLYNSKDERTFTIYCMGGRVNVYFNPSTARLNRFAGGAKRFETDLKIGTESGNMRASIVLDRPAKTFRVFMAGKEIGKIPFKDNEAAEALDVGGMSISPMYSSAVNGRQNRIAGLWLAPWEGADIGEPKKDSSPAPTIHLANGDEFIGAIGKFTGETVTVNSEAGPLDLPAQRLAWIHFPGATADDARHFPHLRFHDRGLLSVQDLRVENDRVKCKTMQGQAIEFPLSLVKEVVWHPQAEK